MREAWLSRACFGTFRRCRVTRCSPRPSYRQPQSGGFGAPGTRVNL